MNLTTRLLLATILVSSLSLTAQAKIDRTVEKVFSVPATGTLHVSTQGGHIHVTVAKDGKATITARERIRADDDQEADELLAKMNLTIEQNGSDVSAIAEYSHGISFNWGPTPVVVSFDIAIPAGFSADARTSGGDIVVTDRSAQLKLKTSGGNITIGNITADIDARTSGGDIVLDSCTSDVELHTSGGNLKVGPVNGSARISTSGGNIRIRGTGAAMHADTSGGDITDDVVGPLKGDCELLTSGGEVKVSLDPSSGFHLDAATSGGSVHAGGLTITIDDGGSGRSKLRGLVNGGGPLLKLRSSGGNIAIITEKGTRQL